MSFRLLTVIATIGLTTLIGPGARAGESPFGTDIQMVQVESSFPAGYHGKITATVDGRGTGLSIFHFTDSRNSSLDFTTDQLRQGVVLVHALGKDILKIAGPGFSDDGGGQMVLTFLRGFFGNDKREVRFDYVRRGAITDWVLQTDDQAGRDPFDMIHVDVSKTLGLPTGVGGIVLDSSERTVRRYDPAELPAGTLMLDGVDPSLAE
jgi:hypothetical protein